MTVDEVEEALDEKIDAYKFTKSRINIEYAIKF